METVKTYNFSKKRILILGLGHSNVSVIKFLSQQPIESLMVTDLMGGDKDEVAKVKKNAAKVKKLYPECKFVLGSHEGIDLSDIDLVIKNPSISSRKAFLQRIIEKGIPIETDVSLLFKLVPRRKIIGITGTKGKSTTSTLIASSLNDQGANAILCGNIGIPVFEHISEYENADYIVVELSSYMIDSLNAHNLSPHVAVFTSICQDHLDFHGSVENYIQDKLNLSAHQTAKDRTFANTDCLLLAEKIERREYPVQYFSASDIEGQVTTSLRGRHYLANIAGVLKVCTFILGNDFDFEVFKTTIKNFHGLHSRMETIGIVKNVEFINNSKATDTIAFCVDLNTLIQEKKNIYLLCGGGDKDLDLTHMSELLGDKSIQKIALFDNSGSHRLLPTLEQEKVIGFYKDVASAFADIIKELEQIALPDSVVIMMPGTGTFGIFNLDEGAEQYNKLVHEYKAKSEQAPTTRR